MAKGYDSLNDTFNTDGSVEVDAIVKADEVTKVAVSYTHLRAHET